MYATPSGGRTGYTSQMSHAFDLMRRRRRRQVVLGAITILLHLIVFDWIGGQLGLPHEEPASAEPPLVAQLISDAPRPVPASVPPPKLSLPPLPALDPEPVAEAGPPPQALPQPAQPVPAEGNGNGAPGDSGEQASSQSGAAGAGSVQSEQAQASNGAARAEPPAAAEPAPEVRSDARHYKVDLPPSSDITLDVARVDANGTRWSGEESLSWRIAPAGYRIRLEATISVLLTRVNLLTVTSEGTVGDDGFNPTLMTEKRRGRAMTATHFNRADGTLTFSGSQARYPLTPGAQDKASVTLQLVAIARADPKQLSGTIDIFVGEDRDASVFSFTVAGQEQIDTPLGRIATWHLVRPPKPGSYSSRLDLWLAPSYGWLPVQIRNLEASGAVTTQTARKIEKKDAGNS
jgi:hypothetical protein